MRRSSLIVAALLAVSAPASAANASSLVDLAPVASADAPVTAYGGWVVWSEKGPDGRWRLVTFHDGVKQDLAAVAPRAVPFDVDAGPGASGRPEVSFSRCENETRARGCRLRTVSLTSGGEAGLAVPGRGSASFTLPSRWGERVVFQRQTRGEAVAEILLYDLRTRRTKRLHHGPVPDGTGATAQATAIDLGRRTVAYSWISSALGAGIGRSTDLLTQRTRDGRQLPDLAGGLVDGACDAREPRSPNAVEIGALFLEYVARCDAEEGGLTTLYVDHRKAGRMAPLPNLRRIARDAADGTVYAIAGSDGAPRLVRLDAAPPFVTGL